MLRPLMDWLGGCFPVLFISERVILLAGGDGIEFALIALSSAFNPRKVRKMIILITGGGLLIQSAVMRALLGRAIDTFIVLVPVLVILCGGLLMDPVEADKYG